MYVCMYAIFSSPNPWVLSVPVKVTFKVLVAASMKIALMMKAASTCTKLHGATTQKAVVFITCVFFVLRSLGMQCHIF
jgi:hypothetical protein